MFMVENGGLNSDADYPYMAKDGVCDKSKVEKAYSINGYAHIEPNNENLIKAVMSRFPVAAYIRVTQSQLMQYNGEILLTKGWGRGAYLSHVVVLVGYDTENGVD
ncbi:putative actinidain [Helianthus anomalus]